MSGTNRTKMTTGLGGLEGIRDDRTAGYDNGDERGRAHSQERAKPVTYLTSHLYVSYLMIEIYTHKRKTFSGVHLTSVNLQTRAFTYFN